MKILTNRIISAIISVHLMIAYIVGLNTQPFDESPYFIFMILPVLVFLGIAFYALHLTWNKYDTDTLEKNIKATIKDVWSWCLVFLTSFLFISITYYSGQMFLPAKEMSQSITWNGDPWGGNLCGLIASGLFYFASLMWLRKSLRIIWK